VNIKELETHWNEFGNSDPLYAILTEVGKDGNRWDLEEFFALGKKEIEGLLDHVGSLGLHVKPGRALDFGCGVGRLTQALAAHFVEVWGVDIAPSMIDLANRYNRHRDRCSYQLNRKCDLNIFKNNTFDFIYSNITLQHMAPRYSQAYIQEFIRILSPEGLMVFQLPTSTSVHHKIGFRQLVKSLLPNKLLVAYRKMRYGGLKPVMQMYGIDKDVIVKMLEEENGTILHIKQEPTTQEGWLSNLYFVTKVDSSTLGTGS
jgi:ubiquinone/menaquinone biosynthesis C-methylase UbiE